MPIERKRKVFLKTDVIRDSNLSLAAKGLYGVIKAYEEDAFGYIAWFMASIRESEDPRAAIEEHEQAFNELAAAGYLGADDES